MSEEQKGLSEVNELRAKLAASLANEEKLRTNVALLRHALEREMYDCANCDEVRDCKEFAAKECMDCSTGEAHRTLQATLEESIELVEQELFRAHYYKELFDLVAGQRDALRAGWKKLAEATCPTDLGRSEEAPAEAFAVVKKYAQAVLQVASPSSYPSPGDSVWVEEVVTALMKCMGTELAHVDHETAAEQIRCAKEQLRHLLATLPPSFEHLKVKKGGQV